MVFALISVHAASATLLERVQTSLTPYHTVTVVMLTCTAQSYLQIAAASVPAVPQLQPLLCCGSVQAAESSARHSHRHQDLAESTSQDLMDI